jgi:hypothetical protein
MSKSTPPQLQCRKRLRVRLSFLTLRGAGTLGGNDESDRSHDNQGRSFGHNPITDDGLAAAAAVTKNAAVL